MTGFVNNFLNSSLLNIYYLLCEMHCLAKFQPDMSITLGVAAPQSSNNRKTDLYSKYGENVLQELTNKMTHTVKICTIVFVISRGID